MAAGVAAVVASMIHGPEAADLVLLRRSTALRPTFDSLSAECEPRMGWVRCFDDMWCLHAAPLSAGGQQSPLRDLPHARRRCAR